MQRRDWSQGIIKTGPKRYFKIFPNQKIEEKPKY
jgi:hypothetical protein